MSDRYALFEIGKLFDRYNLATGVPKGVKPSYNISPTQLAPVVLVRDGERVLERMKWGFIPHRAKDANSVFRYKTFNAKSEDVLSNNNWRHSIRYKRCLVPVNGFYGWKAVPGDKQAHYVSMADKRMFSLAGVYSSWEDPEGVTWGTYAIITTPANKEMTPLGDRMPAIVHPEDEATWLDSSVDDANTLFDIMRPYFHREPLSISRVGADIFSVKIDKPDLIKPIK